jgi:hypothetical protein
LRRFWRVYSYPAGSGPSLTAENRDPTELGYEHRIFNIETNQESRKDSTMRWETPTFIELNMSAEIGSYSDDFDGI